MKRASALHDAPAPEPRLYRVVSDRIEALIRAENIRPGERLPSERELSIALGVSRTSLREALIALELGGVVEVRGGSGVYVSERASAQDAAPAAGPGPLELLAARRSIEAEVAAMAARNASASAIDAILAALEQMERQHEKGVDHEAADRNFHLAIARAAGNSALVGVLDYLWNQRSTPWHEMNEHGQTEALRRQALIDHRSILAAIAAHDFVGARQAMRAHLDRVTRTFARG